MPEGYRGYGAVLNAVSLRPCFWCCSTQLASGTSAGGKLGCFLKDKTIFVGKNDNDQWR